MRRATSQDQNQGCCNRSGEPLHAAGVSHGKPFEVTHTGCCQSSGNLGVG
ncbi:hypothetical protein ACFPRL_02660 [Pseudoclavibacter helvolus]